MSGQLNELSWSIVLLRIKFPLSAAPCHEPRMIEDARALKDAIEQDSTEATRPGSGQATTMDEGRLGT